MVLSDLETWVVGTHVVVLDLHDEKKKKLELCVGEMAFHVVCKLSLARARTD